MIIDAADNLSRGTDDWRDSYIAQGDQKQSQIEAMIRYAQSNQCRMSSLVRHFGDTADSQKPCGICDFCAPESCVAQRFRDATEQEQTVARDVMNALRMNRKSVGKLHTELCGKNGMDRDGFEELMGAMARAGLVRLVDSVFEKDGKQIPFRLASLTGDAKHVDARHAPRTEDSRDCGIYRGRLTGKKSRKKRPGRGEAEIRKARHRRVARERSGSTAWLTCRSEAEGVAARPSDEAGRAGVPNHVRPSAAGDCGERAEDSGRVAGHSRGRDQAGGEVRFPDLQDLGRIAIVGQHGERAVGQARIGPRHFFQKKRAGPACVQLLCW